MSHRGESCPRSAAEPRRSVPFGLTNRWAACRRGNSAVEFSLLAPALLLSLLATFDFGTGMSQRMALDHVLRAGAQSAMFDSSPSTVEAAMSSAAELTFSDGLPRMSVDRFCACPGALETAVACTTVCTGSQPTFTYYRMNAELTYSGIIVPPMDFERSLRVQVR